MFVLVELRCNDCTNKKFSPFERKLFRKTLTEVTIACWLCEYRIANAWYKNVDTEKSTCEPE